MRLRVLIISVRADVGGGPEHIFQLMKNSKNRIDYFVACPNEKPYFKRYEETIGNNKMIIIKKRRFSIFDLIKLIKFVYKNNIDIIHSHGKGAGVYSRLLRLFTFRKVVHTFHGLHIDGYSIVLKNIYILLERFFTVLTDKIISVSKSEKKELIKKRIASNKIVVINNGVEVYNENPYYKKKTNKKEFVILNINRFNYQKNPELVLNIAECLINKKEENFKIVILGDGDDFDNIKRKIEKENYSKIIKLTGNVLNPSEYYEKTDIFLSTSRWEGLSLAVLEAMSFGLPVVASDVVGNRDVVKNEYNGFLFDLKDFESACKFICLLINNNELRYNMSNNAFEFVKNGYDIKNSVKKTIDLYYKIVNEN